MRQHSARWFERAVPKEVNEVVLAAESRQGGRPPMSNTTIRQAVKESTRYSNVTQVTGCTLHMLQATHATVYMYLHMCMYIDMYTLYTHMTCTCACACTCYQPQVTGSEGV